MASFLFIREGHYTWGWAALKEWYHAEAVGTGLVYERTPLRDGG